MEKYEIRHNKDIPTEAFLYAFSKINDLMMNSTSPHLGNLYYLGHGRIDDNSIIHNNEITKDFVDKRRNFRHAVLGKSLMLEIGMNAGHSALLALESNPDLKYIGIDICRTAYTIPCGQVLKDIYGDRFELIEGDSRVAFPEFLEDERCPEVDIVHIDGGHSDEIVKCDISNLLKMPQADGVSRHVLFDDTGIRWVSDEVCVNIGKGHFRTESLGGLWAGRTNMLLEVCTAG